MSFFKRFLIGSLAFAAFVVAPNVRDLAAQESATETADNGITQMMKQYGLGNSVADLTPTICRLAGVRTPDVCVAKPIDAVWNGRNRRSVPTTASRKKF